MSLFRLSFIFPRAGHPVPSDLCRSEDLREKREELNRQILKEEEDKAKIQKDKAQRRSAESEAANDGFIYRGNLDDFG